MAQQTFISRARTSQKVCKSRGRWSREDHIRHRDYSPTIGRFIERDPLGFEAGDNNWYRFVANGPTIHNDPTGQAITSLDAAIERCISLPTTAAQIACLENLLGLGMNDAKLKTVIAKLKPIVECEAIYASYKAAAMLSGGYDTDANCKSLAGKCAGLAAEVAGRKAYLAKKCDYILPGSIAHGSALKEKGHQVELANKTRAAARCAARLAKICCPKPT